MNTEKEWFDNGIFKGDFREELISLLEQQKKRDWKEFREMVESVADEKYPVYVDTYRAYRGRLKKKIDAKLAELNKPKE